MIERLQITVLADNCVAAPSLLAEHGLSMLIEADDQRILFDTGQGRVLRDNLATLGIALAPLDAIVLSHGHYDHTGGLSAALGETSARAIFVHPAAMTRKFAKRERPPYRSIGMPATSREALNGLQERLVWTRAATEVVPGVWCTGEIPRTQKNETSAQSFFLDEEGHEPDPLLDDQALFVETIRGLVIVAGCAHAGVVNTVNHVCKLAGRNEIHALIGGLHLGRVSHKQLEETGSALGRLNFRILAPCHCTGMSAHAYLRARFHSLVQDVGAGSSLVFDGR
jgi:7,8-dihydropterin-6-yl-methyl-4-(beta-D-ribofuranosyl)aminobenzene 5'-phosphate synthase